MLEGARRRIGDRAAIRRADITKPLEFVDDGEFGGVVCGLSLHYVEDWRRPFTEFARILRSGGFLVFSAQHPVDEYIAFEVENYFEIEQERMTWSAGGKEIDVPFYRRPFSEVINPLVETGFELDEPVEPTPNETFKDEKPSPTRNDRRTRRSFVSERRYPSNDRARTNRARRFRSLASFPPVSFAVVWSTRSKFTAVSPRGSHPYPMAVPATGVSNY